MAGPAGPPVTLVFRSLIAALCRGRPPGTQTVPSPQHATQAQPEQSESNEMRVQVAGVYRFIRSKPEKLLPRRNVI